MTLPFLTEIPWNLRTSPEVELQPTKFEFEEKSDKPKRASYVMISSRPTRHFHHFESLFHTSLGPSYRLCYLSRLLNLIWDSSVRRTASCKKIFAWNETQGSRLKFQTRKLPAFCRCLLPSGERGRQPLSRTSPHPFCVSAYSFLIHVFPYRLYATYGQRKPETIGHISRTKSPFSSYLP